VTDSTGQSASALDDVRVLDLTGEMGAYCTKLLADLGADVVRVEPPSGDPIRYRAPFLGDAPGPESSLLHLHLNTSKRGITLDLERAEGRAVFKRLVSSADVVVETFAPGYLAGLGLAYADLIGVKPDLILTSITGFGQDGPHARFETCDLVGVAMSGIMTLSGFPDLPPYRPYPSQGYYCASIEAAIGTLVAVTHRDLHGEGQWVDVSMQESLSMAQETAMQSWDFQKTNRKRAGGGVRLGLIGLYECADGYVYNMIGAVGAGAPVSEFIRWMDEEGKAGDLVTSGVLADMEEAARLPRGAPGAMERLAGLREKMGKVQAVATEFIKGQTMQVLYEEGQAHGFLLGPANTPRDLVESRQLNARAWFVDLPHPELGTTLRMPGLPYRISDCPARLRRPAPLLGEHNAEVYGGELGLTAAELTALRSAGVV